MPAGPKAPETAAGQHDAIGTPSSTHRAVLAVAVFRLNSKAVRDDSEEISGMKCGQSIRSSIATNGDDDERRADRSGQVDPAGQAYRNLTARDGFHGTTKPASVRPVRRPDRSRGRRTSERPQGFRLPERGDRVAVHGVAGFRKRHGADLRPHCSRR